MGWAEAEKKSLQKMNCKFKIYKKYIWILRIEDIEALFENQEHSLNNLNNTVKRT